MSNKKTNISHKVLKMKFMTKNNAEGENNKKIVIKEEEKWSLKHLYKNVKDDKKSEILDEENTTRMSFGNFNPCFEVKKKRGRAAEGEIVEEGRKQQKLSGKHTDK
ncbi:unnamed protein product [Blepharisma stoltei]|uniref:Uncharacterized protein n=1 Tax=Blepharisma stoltei TaxID=1481888 RepID=A0AAU9IQZ3_9CILI|nr:unnamed protein product [Blepharisma stoltei]